jgi:hypothetical protein
MCMISQCVGVEDPGVAGQGLVRLASSLDEQGNYTIFISIVPIRSVRHVSPLPIAEDRPLPIADEPKLPIADERRGGCLAASTQE